MVCVSGASFNVVRALIDFLKNQGQHAMELGTLRPDAMILKALRQMAESGEIRIRVTPDEASFETPLPDTWPLYLNQLNSKQRHEVRRKIRRLEAAGSVAFYMADSDNQEEFTETFLTLFRKNREDKAVFMSDQMAGYFRELIRELAEHRMLRLFVLTVDQQPASTVLCFDHNGVRYLYNSGYDECYHDLSVGVLCKVFSIQHAIETGCRRYDFLKGAEIYKKRIGGQEVPLYHCRVEFE
jgi:CelD/BcsL family acetyltransferase involved in cellulose biosynthesis